MEKQPVRLMVLVLLLLGLILPVVPSHCIAAEPSDIVETSDEAWGTTEYLLEGVADALIIVDWMQTVGAADQKKKDRNGQAYHSYSESNPVLGEHPNRNNVRIYFASLLATKIAAAYLLPKKWNNLFNGVVIIFEGITVSQNFRAGVTMRF